MVRKLVFSFLYLCVCVRLIKRDGLFGEITLTVYAELWHVRNLPGYDDEMAGAT